ncbi:MAG TPA: hypothetical protein VIQ80_02750, partial [Candidatus Saccharimonadales bacterium]
STPEATKAEDALAKQLQKVAPGAAGAAVTPSVADLQKDLAEASAAVDAAAGGSSSTQIGPVEANQIPAGQDMGTPSMGGTLNATTEQAEKDKRRDLEDERNRTILTHGSGNSYVGGSTPAFQSPLNAASQPPEEQQMVDPFRSETPEPTFNAVPSTAPPLSVADLQAVTPAAPKETLADIDRQNRAPHEEARAAVDAAFGAVPFTPSNPSAAAPLPPVEASTPQGTLPPAMLPPMPPMPDFSTLPPLPQAPESSAPLAGALPPDKLEDVLGTPPAPQSSQPAQPNDPAQFKIPGQS